MRARDLIAAGTLCLGLWAVAACNGDPTEPGPVPVTFDLDFTEEAHGWEPGFSDFPVEWENEMEMEARHDLLPEELGMDGGGLFIQAQNRSDDVFMFWTGRMEGLQPEVRYAVAFEVELATEAPAECAGIGGAPGESVHLKAGAASIRPQREGVDGYFQMNIDKGNQFQGGEDAIRIGDVAGTNPDCLEWVWEIKTVVSEDPFEVVSDGAGGVWLIVGTDSGFEGRTRLFYTRVRADFTPM